MANDAKAFLDKVDQDPQLQKKLQDAQASIITLAKENGFNFTQEELHEELRSRWEISKPKDDPDTCTVTAP